VTTRLAIDELRSARPGAVRPDLSLRSVEVNGGGGALFLDPERRLIGVVALDIASGQIIGISGIVNPDKLAHLGPVADLRALLGAGQAAVKMS
jgi:hypothetical protein